MPQGILGLPLSESAQRDIPKHQLFCVAVRWWLREEKWSQWLGIVWVSVISVFISRH